MRPIGQSGQAKMGALELEILPERAFTGKSRGESRWLRVIGAVPKTPTPKPNPDRAEAELARRLRGGGPPGWSIEVSARSGVPLRTLSHYMAGSHRLTADALVRRSRRRARCGSNGSPPARTDGADPGGAGARCACWSREWATATGWCRCPISTSCTLPRGDGAAASSTSQKRRISSRSTRALAAAHFEVSPRDLAMMPAKEARWSRRSGRARCCSST